MTEKVIYADFGKPSGRQQDNIEEVIGQVFLLALNDDIEDRAKQIIGQQISERSRGSMDLNIVNLLARQQVLADLSEWSEALHA